MKVIDASTCRTLNLGMQGENNVTCIDFSAFCDARKREMGAGVAELVHDRKKDNDPYLVTLVDNKWYISSADLKYACHGNAQLTYTVSADIKKSFYWETVIQESIGETTTPADPWKSHLDSVIAETAKVYAVTAKEEERIAAENARAAAETNRVTTETARIAAEVTRNQNETNRTSAEQARAAAEAIRVSNNTSYTAAELARQQAEAARVEEEAKRVAAEEEREEYEEVRNENEADRSAAESARETAEAARIAAESQRVNDFSSKQNVIPDLETIRAGAALGATALQVHQDISGKQDVLTQADKQAIADLHVDPDISAFITRAVSDLANYYLKSETYTKTEVNNLVSAIPKFAIKVVSVLPTTDISVSTIYLLKTSTTETGNLYSEYIYSNNAWELLGTQTLDISGKVDKSALFDAGIKSISWSTSLQETTLTTVTDPYASQRPSGTNTRYWVEFANCPCPVSEKLFRITFNDAVYTNLVSKAVAEICSLNGSKHVNSTDGTRGGGYGALGNRALYDSRYEDTGEPFCIIYIMHGGMFTNSPYYYTYNRGSGILFTRNADTIKLKIESGTVEKTTINNALLPNFGYGDEVYEKLTGSTYCRTSLGGGNICGRNSYAIGNSNVVTGFASCAIGASCESTGGYSFAIGYHSIASGLGSMAIGTLTEDVNGVTHATISSGGDSLAVGGGSTASGFYSVAFGGSTASGNCSAAIGNQCKSTKNGSIALCYKTQATGNAAFAEGYTTTSEGNASHAEGWMTKALSANQHVEGKCNIADNESKYVHIVGNGTSDSSRSNAHTLDWDGNAWYAGSVDTSAVILRSPNGTKYRLTVDDNGILMTKEV